jgi:glycosyltransferase involved in cell wall biosynthesis
MAGVDDLVAHGVNGIVVEDAQSASFAQAFEQLATDPELWHRLHEGALRSARGWRFERSADRIEVLLEAVTRPHVRAVFLGKTRIPLPPTPDHERKYEIHGRYLRSIVVCVGDRVRVGRVGGASVFTVPTFRPRLLSAVAFYTGGPVSALVLSSGRRRTAVVCQSPYEAFGVILLGRMLPRKLRAQVQVELHGDWRTASRLYGSSARRLASCGADRIATWALRRADRVRTVSRVLEQLARANGYAGPIDRFVAFSDYSMFFDTPPTPLRIQPHVLFVGVLERYKAVDVLLGVWPSVLDRVPHATLTLVGTGSLESRLSDRIRRERLSESVRLRRPVPRSELRRLLDDSWALVLPSRSEGLPRIVLEAMAAGRAVVATNVGGIEELVADGINGRVVPSDDRSALADALVDVLADRRRAEAMGRESRRRAIERDPLGEYEAGIKRLSQWIATS